MMARRNPITLTAAITLCAAMAGCMGSGADEARRAELAGNYHRAYDLYVRAAEVNHRSRLLGLAIARLAPQAASHWETQAHRAMDQHDHAEAWRLFMRVLEIRPDHPSAPHLIRRIERDHPDAVAPIRTAWLQSGFLALRGPVTRLARSEPPTRMPPVAQPDAKAQIRREVVAAPAPPMPTKPPQARPSRPSATGPARTVRPLPYRTAIAAPPGYPGRRSAAGRPTASALRPVSSTRPSPRRPSVVAAPSRTALARTSSSEYLTVRTLSKKDRRFPKKVELLDGLVIEVRDTDDDPDADFNIYLHGKRIAKCKGVKPRERRGVFGRSGRRYEVVLLEINDRRQTIRIGIRAIRTRSRSSSDPK